MKFVLSFAAYSVAVIVLSGCSAVGSQEVAAEIMDDCPIGATASIYGRVVGVAGSPIAGAVVRLDPKSDYTLSWQTDRSGGFRFACMPAGPYRLEAEAQGYALQAKEIEPVAGRELRYDIHLDRSVVEVEFKPTRTGRDFQHSVLVSEN